MKYVKLSTNKMNEILKSLKNLGDLNGDGKIDMEDVKVATEKAGVAWNSISPDTKNALLNAGVTWGAVTVAIPVFGPALALPTAVGVGAYSFVKSKLTKKE